MMTRRVFHIALLLGALGSLGVPPAARADLAPVVPANLRGRLDAERAGTHDANNMRTTFWNYGMVGDYPSDPGNVDLSVFHSMEVPKGTGMNYSDGVTPFVLAKIKQRDGSDSYIMETGYRERQAISAYRNTVMRFEPRPGFFQADPKINKGRSPAISNDPRTWPGTWPDKQLDRDDPGWNGSWNGYFGKRPAADQESFSVMDDDFYDAWDFYPDSRDTTRRGLGLRVEVRGFQWANPQAGNVIFWHYDIINEGTTDYDDNVIFGLYMDAGVGGSAFSCDGIYESDDDNAYFDKSSGLNLVYTYDNNGHGVDLRGNCSPTGYLGYAYLETPGNAENGIDDDEDGITDESRSSGPGQHIVGKEAIRAYAESHYNMDKFEAYYGPLENRPAYRNGSWWTGDEDMDWDPEFDDVGADGVEGTHDTGEGDGMPTAGEPNFDKTDVDESDQIGLTGFKMNRIKSGAGNPDQTADGIVFYTDSQNWPQRLYEKWTDPFTPSHFDSAVASNYNIGFLFASGPFKLRAGQQERFSLALAYGADLTELKSTVKIVKAIYAANYQFATPPPVPTLTAEAGSHYVRLSWDDVAERGIDPVVHTDDFKGYRIYRSTDPNFLDAKVISDGRGSGAFGYRPVAQFDLKDGRSGFSRVLVGGVAYYLGDQTGLTHTWTDTTVTNGQEYYYAVTSYDYGPKYAFKNDSLEFYPSENAISVSRTPRGGVILPQNVVAVRPNPRVGGFMPASADTVTRISGEGVGTLKVRMIQSAQVPDGHVMHIRFFAPDPDSIRATEYTLVDSTTGATLIAHGQDLEGLGIGPVGAGLLPVAMTDSVPQVDLQGSTFRDGSATTVGLKITYLPGLTKNRRRPGYPENFTVTFSGTVIDTSYNYDDFRFKAVPIKFRVVAHGPDGDRKLFVRFRESTNKDSTLSRVDESFDVLTFAPGFTGAQTTWRVQLDTTGAAARGGLKLPGDGDVYDFRLRKPFGDGDAFRFVTTGERVDAAGARAAFVEKPYVVPNPYVGSASFEPERFAVSGRGERRIEFRAIPKDATIRIYTVRGELVQTLHQNGSREGFVPWNLRTKDNLDLAPGLYIYHVDAPLVGTYVGKFAVLK